MPAARRTPAAAQPEARWRAAGGAAAAVLVGLGRAEARWGGSGSWAPVGAPGASSAPRASRRSPRGGGGGAGRGRA